MFSSQTVGCCRGFRCNSLSPPLRGGFASDRHTENINRCNLAGTTVATSRPCGPGGTSSWPWSSSERQVVAALSLGGNDNGGTGGIGRYSGGGGNGRGNNNNNNNSNSDGFGDPLRRSSGPALLGALGLVAATAAFPAASRATPGSLSGVFFHGAGGSPKDSLSLLSSSAPIRGGGGLSDALALERGSTGLSCISSTSSSPSRPRSKVMHVSCKGSTLVVPLCGHDAKEVGIPLAGVLPWQRRKIVDAPVELSEREARMLAGRQNRVRDSLLVQ